MKTKITYTLALCTLFLLTACGNDWLDMEPNTSVESGKAITDLQDIEFAANGLYSTMQSSSYYGAQMTYYGDLTGDDMRSFKSTSSGSSFYHFKYNKENATNSFWSVYYSLAKNAAIALKSMEKLSVTPGKVFITAGGIRTTEDAFYNSIRGQILTIRGLALFDMTRLYGYPYTKDQGASWGVPIVTNTVDKDYKPLRNTVKECYTAILADFEAAESLINENTQNGRFNKWSLFTLLSRVHLYMGNSEKALHYAEEGIKGAEANGYGLLENDEYAAAWSKPFNKEFLFEVINLTTDSPGKSSIGYLHRKYIMIATNKFFKNNLAKTDDVRKQLVNTENGSRPYCMKFPEQDGKSYEDCNVVVLRMSELYLNAAEAAVKLNLADKATTYFTPIYKRTNQPWTNAVVTLDDVLEQRRIEFWGEGHRFFDLIRNEKTVERVDYLESVALDARTFDWDFYRIVLPVPRTETNVNHDIQQNPGYGD